VSSALPCRYHGTHAHQKTLQDRPWTQGISSRYCANTWLYRGCRRTKYSERSARAVSRSVSFAAWRGADWLCLSHWHGSIESPRRHAPCAVMHHHAALQSAKCEAARRRVGDPHNQLFVSSPYRPVTSPAGLYAAVPCTRPFHRQPINLAPSLTKPDRSGPGTRRTVPYRAGFYSAWSALLDRLHNRVPEPRYYAPSGYVCIGWADTYALAREEREGGDVIITIAYFSSCSRAWPFFRFIQWAEGRQSGSWR